MMRYRMTCGILILGAFFVMVEGCAHVRTYSEDKERVDQVLVEGNQGYLAGQPKEAPQVRKTTRKTYVAEVELGSVPRRNRKKKAAVSVPIQEAQSPAETTVQERAVTQEAAAAPKEPIAYKVEPNDTLQKISQKFYGTMNRWKKIFEANKDRLKTPDRIYPGQEIMIPQE